MVFLIAIFCSYNVVAQRTVTGTVRDGMDGSTLPSVNVVIKGTTTGTITDFDGAYSINVTGDKPVLRFTLIGYKPVEVTLKPNQDKIDVRLEEDAELLDEVVVVGYGTMKKSDLSGASVSMGEEKIKGSIITNLDQAFKGRAAGVESMQTSGAPGSSVSIRIRGQATINAGAEPLYVVDGVIIQAGGSSGADFGLGDALGNGSKSTISPMSSINPSDIVSMEILKDASATAIYGAQGANGVVLITTKRGKAGDAKFTYEGMFGVQQQKARLKMMKLSEFAEYSNSVAAESNTLDERPEYSDPSLLGDGTNWQDAVFRDAMMQQHQVSAQGGTDKVKYYISGSYMNQDGVIIGTNFSRYSFRTNLDADLKKWLKVGVNVMYSNTDEELGLADSSEGVINYSLLTPPDIPVYDVDGNYSSTMREGYTRINPIGMANDNDISLNRTKMVGNLFLDIKPMDNLILHSELGYDINGSKGERFYPAVQYGSWARPSNSSSIQENNSLFWQIKNYLTYTGNVDKHNYTLMVGQECWESTYRYQSVTAQNLPSNDIKNPSLGEDAKITSGFGSSAMASFFGRGTYNYDERYMATYTYRRDGSSNFGPKNRWADFHSFAASWRFSNEVFFESIEEILSNGKLRIGWGQTGNANISGYRWGSSISKMETGLGLGYRQSNIANPYVKWETQEQTNIGIDLGFLNDRINLVVDAYIKESKDMLMPMQLPSYMGTRGNGSSALASPWGNYGHISNEGIEFSLNTRNLTGQFTWDTDFNISFNKNKLKGLDGLESSAIEGYGQWSDVVSLTRIGQPLFNFYGYKVDGIYKDLDDLKNSPKPAKYPADGNFNRYNTVWVGDIKYKDLSGPDGVPDGIIDEYDRTDLGSPFPKFTFGFSNSFSYKNFDANIFINGCYGNKIYNYMAMNLSNMKSTWDNQLSKVTNRAVIAPVDASKVYPAVVNGVTVNNWYDDITNVTVINPNTDVPRAIANDPNDNDRISDRYIEDGSYLRIASVTIGYTFPKKMIRSLKIDNLRIYAQGQNLHTFTNYSGYDPEIGANTANVNVYGLDNGRYPSPKTYSIGVSITL